MVTFFDETQARSIGMNPTRSQNHVLHAVTASTVAALQTVGAFLVIGMVVTPGATAYLLTDRFRRLLVISVAIGSTTSFVGAYTSYFLDGATGGISSSCRRCSSSPSFSSPPSTACWRPAAARSGTGGRPMTLLDLLLVAAASSTFMQHA